MTIRVCLVVCSQGFCCAQGGDNSVFIDFVRITAMAIKGVIEIPNPSFEENPEVASCAWTPSSPTVLPLLIGWLRADEYKLPNGWQGSGGGTVVVKSPPSAPNGPWGAGSAVAQGAPDGDYFMSIRAQLGLPVPRVAVAWLLTDRGRW